jgi:DNA polymerase III gamma/tau subunit
VRDLVAALIAQDAAAGLEIIAQAVDGGSDPQQFGQQVIEHLRAILVTQTASADLVEAAQEDRQLYQQQAGQISRAALLRALRSFNDAVNDYRGGWQPQLALEMALVESLDQADAIYSPPPQPAPRTQAAPQAQTAPAAKAAPKSSGGGDAAAQISASAIHARWTETQQEARQYEDKSVAPLMDHARVESVEGNTVIVSVPNAVFMDKLNDRLDFVEQALSTVHQTPLRVQFVLAKTDSTTAQIDTDDPVIAKGLELGGQASPYDDERS